MAVMFLDTNLFLRFYEATASHLGAFDELLTNAKSVVLTDQVVDEFNRNRLNKLGTALKAFKDGSRGSADTAVVRALPSYEALVKAREEYQRRATVVERAIEALMQDRMKDPIATRFDQLHEQCRDTYAVSKKAIKRAQRRKLLGNPPTSSKNTIGDEVNWEALLESCDHELVICSEDGTFTANEGFLKDEYARRTKRQLKAVCKTFAEALKLVGQPPSEELVKQEESLEKDIRQRRVLEPMSAADRFRFMMRRAVSDDDEDLIEYAARMLLADSAIKSRFLQVTKQAEADVDRAIERSTTEVEPQN
jgi:hypothetical protein